MQNIDESVLFRAHPHPFFIIRLCVTSIIFALIPLILSGGFNDQSTPSATLILWWLVILSFILLNVQRWASNLVVLTNSRVIIHRGGLRKKSTWSLPINKIETARITFSSRFNRLLSLGSVELNTGDETMILRHIRHPEAVLNVITKVTAFLSNLSIREENTAANQNDDSRVDSLITTADTKTSFQEQPIQSWVTPAPIVLRDHLDSQRADFNINELTEDKAVYF